MKDVHELVSWGLTNSDFINFMKDTPYRERGLSEKVGRLWKSFVGALGQLLGIDNSPKAVSMLEEFLNQVEVVMNSAAQKEATQPFGSFQTRLSGMSENTGSQETSVQQGNDPIIQAMAAANAQVNRYTTQDIHEALDRGNITVAFEQHLSGLLNSVVRKLHGPFGMFKDMQVQDQAMTAADVWAKALATGQAPFASKVVASPFSMSEKELFVIEQVEATAREALATDTLAYGALRKLYQEAEKTLTAEKFHDGDWATATPDEKALAQEK